MMVGNGGWIIGDLMVKWRLTPVWLMLGWWNQPSFMAKVAQAGLIKDWYSKVKIS